MMSSKVDIDFVDISSLCVCVIVPLLFNTNSAIFQLYHGENKLIFNDYDDEVRFVLHQHALVDFIVLTH